MKNLEENENIEVLKVSIKDLSRELRYLEARGEVVNAKLWAFAYGLSLHSAEK